LARKFAPTHHGAADLFDNRSGCLLLEGNYRRNLFDLPLAKKKGTVGRIGRTALRSRFKERSGFAAAGCCGENREGISKV